MPTPNPAQDLREDAATVPGGYPLDSRPGAPITLTVSMESANGGNEGASDRALPLSPPTPVATQPSSNAGFQSAHGLG